MFIEILVTVPNCLFSFNITLKEDV